MIFDTHTHLDDAVYEKDLTQLLREAHDVGVARLLTVGTNISSSASACALAEKYTDIQKENALPAVYAAVGVHPLFLPEIATSAADTPAFDAALNSLYKLAAHPRVVAIGEIGLDYRYRHKNPSVIPVQKAYFHAQLSMCETLQLPACVHSIGAASDTLDLIAAHRNVCGVLHGFSYALPFARECLRLGWYIGVGAVVTRPNARKIREILREIPLDRLLLETDSPYQPPHARRGQRGIPTDILYIIEEIAALRGCTPAEITAATTKNARRLFLRSYS